MIHRHVVTAPAALYRKRTFVLHKRRGMFSGMPIRACNKVSPTSPAKGCFSAGKAGKSRAIINGADR